MEMLRKISHILSVLFFLNSSLSQIAYPQSILPNPEYIGFIQQKITSYSIYPPEAKAKSWEGIVRVKFTLAQDGRIKEIDIAESSGYPLLDAAAILAIKDASPYPFPEDYPIEGELEIILPVIYQQPKPLTEALPEKTPTLPTYESPKLEVQVFSLYQEAEPPIKEIKEETLALHHQELGYFINLALKNNQPTKVAREEVELAQLKVTEAQRNFFPSLKISGYNTEGEVFKVDYEEREAKVQVDQPLFYGGRLKDTLSQSKVNLEITQKNYDRLKLDVVHKTETAYYNLVAAKMHLQQKEALQQEAKEMLEKIEKLVAADMATPLEANSARAWFKQIEFQIDSISHDLFMAELTFKQVLNIKEAPRIEAQLLEAKRLNLDLGTCIEAALLHRPEVYLSELLVKFNDYGQKIEASKEKAFTVDLITSYGRYQGRYKTEPWLDSDNWSAGVKVNKPWGGNTFNTSYTQEESQKRFGQTSPTAASTLSAEFSLLDNLKRLSDKKKSDIDLHRSLSDFNESAKTVAFEVQDAFLNYQKAVLQLNTAEAEMKFRRSEAEVTKVRAMVGETSLSSVMESLYNLSEVQTKYIQALANYQISLANLKKATGYDLTI